MNEAPRTALVITPSFFGYERDIVSELERQGFAVTLLDERPSNSPLARAIMRVRKSVISRRIEAYYRRWQKTLAAASFEIVIVIKAEVVPRWFLQELKDRSPSARLIFYTFDALANAGNCLELLDCFDRRITFDPEDAARRNDFEYLPLFYAPEFHALSDKSVANRRQYDLSFIGTLHSDRYRFATRLLAGLDRVFAFFYVQARWYFIIVKYLTREHANVSWRDVSFKSLTRAETANVFRNSLAVLDMQRAGQAGLTMRTFEVLASGAILVTTNAAIAEEPFFDPARVLIVAGNPTDQECDALRERLQLADAPTGAPPGFEAYSLASWIVTLVGEERVNAGQI